MMHVSMAQNDMVIDQISLQQQPHPFLLHMHVQLLKRDQDMSQMQLRHYLAPVLIKLDA